MLEQEASLYSITELINDENPLTNRPARSSINKGAEAQRVNKILLLATRLVGVVLLAGA